MNLPHVDRSQQLAFSYYFLFRICTFYIWKSDYSRHFDVNKLIFPTNSAKSPSSPWEIFPQTDNLLSRLVWINDFFPHWWKWGGNLSCEGNQAEICRIRRMEMRSYIQSKYCRECMANDAIASNRTIFLIKFSASDRKIHFLEPGWEKYSVLR